MDEIWEKFVESENRTLRDVYDTFNEEQRRAVNILIALATKNEQERIVRLIRES